MLSSNRKKYLLHLMNFCCCKNCFNTIKHIAFVTIKTIEHNSTVDYTDIIKHLSSATCTDVTGYNSTADCASIIITEHVSTASFTGVSGHVSTADNTSIIVAISTADNTSIIAAISTADITYITECTNNSTADAHSLPFEQTMQLQQSSSTQEPSILQYNEVIHHQRSRVILRHC